MPSNESRLADAAERIATALEYFIDKDKEREARYQKMMESNNAMTQQLASPSVVEEPKVESPVPSVAQGPDPIEMAASPSHGPSDNVRYDLRGSMEKPDAG